LSDHPWLDRSGAHDRSSTPDLSSTRDIPLVLVHGLWDTPSLFDLLKTTLAGRRQPLLIPHLPHRWGATSLAELAGVSNPYLSQIERGLRRPSAEILQQLAKALHISAESLYVRAGLLADQPVGANEVRDAIVRDRRLTPEQQQALLNVYDSFVAVNSPPPAEP
jgi:transcriptional regulator with XRE-family HTH domain